MNRVSLPLLFLLFSLLDLGAGVPLLNNITFLFNFIVLGEEPLVYLLSSDSAAERSHLAWQAHSHLCSCCACCHSVATAGSFSLHYQHTVVPFHCLSLADLLESLLWIPFSPQLGTLTPPAVGPLTLWWQSQWIYLLSRLSFESCPGGWRKLQVCL